MLGRAASQFASLHASRSSISNQVAYRLRFLEAFTTETTTPARDGLSAREKAPFITFVLGGPGSGKGTQCSKIVETFGFTHLSAGDLLRHEISSNSDNGAMILETIKEGKIVPSDVTIELIQRAIESSDKHKFLIDGFPRSEENRVAFERIVGAEPDIVLFFDCPEEVMVKRLLSRNQGRIDDNIDTIKKRLKTFEALNLPVINYYSARGKVHKINSVGTADEIFEQVRPVFDAYECSSDGTLSSILKCRQGDQIMGTLIEQLKEASIRRGMILAFFIGLFLPEKKTHMIADLYTV